MPYPEPHKSLSEHENTRITEAAVALGYSVVERLDSGAAGIVFVAKDSAGSNVAIKILRGPYEEMWLRRFRREAEILSRLDHPRVVKVFSPGVVSIADYLAYVMQFVDGVSLRRWLTGNRLITEQEALQLLRSVAEALSYVHENQVIHRDLHAGNILLEASLLTDPKVVDFGTARDYSIEDLTDSAGYRTFRPVGAMSHCAPEKWVTPHEAGPESDVFSLGVMTYIAVTGKHPFWADESYVRLYHSILSGLHTRARQLNDQLSHAFDELLEGMLEPSHVFRIGTMTEVIKECDNLLLRA